MSTELNPVIHAPARLRIAVALSQLGPKDRMSFPRLQKELGMTAGNLSTHVRKLEDAGFVDVAKTHERRTPVTYLALTADGRSALEDYTQALRALLDGAPVAPAPIPTGAITQKEST